MKKWNWLEARRPPSLPGFVKAFFKCYQATSDLLELANIIISLLSLFSMLLVFGNNRFTNELFKFICNWFGQKLQNIRQCVSISAGLVLIIRRTQDPQDIFFMGWSLLNILVIVATTWSSTNRHKLYLKRLNPASDRGNLKQRLTCMYSWTFWRRCLEFLLIPRVASASAACEFNVKYGAGPSGRCPTCPTAFLGWENGVFWENGGGGMGEIWGKYGENEGKTENEGQNGDNGKKKTTLSEG